MTPEQYMSRAIELARKGYPYAMPNPMVGAVIVDDSGKIIGEGYHRKCGEPHAEVNAIASVDNDEALRCSTIYVTLEPCAHYGRTGPCAKLIIDKHIPKVVVGCRDPFDKVDGKGIEMLREAGVQVTVGVLEEECRKLNYMFFTAHTLRRPFIMLKWAESADGYIWSMQQQKISTPLTSALMHRWRAAFDGIIVGSGTVIADNPTLDTRLWPGKSPRPIVLDRRGRIPAEAKVMGRDPIIIEDNKPLTEIMHDLYTDGITSVIVEGGAATLQTFIDAGLWDLARIETGPTDFGEGIKGPKLDMSRAIKTEKYESQTIKYLSKNALIDVKNI